MSSLLWSFTPLYDTIYSIHWLTSENAKVARSSSGEDKVKRGSHCWNWKDIRKRSYHGTTVREIDFVRLKVGFAMRVIRVPPVDLELLLKSVDVLTDMVLRLGCFLRVPFCGWVPFQQVRFSGFSSVEHTSHLLVPITNPGLRHPLSLSLSLDFYLPYRLLLFVFLSPSSNSLSLCLFSHNHTPSLTIMQCDSCIQSGKRKCVTVRSSHVSDNCPHQQNSRIDLGFCSWNRSTSISIFHLPKWHFQEIHLYLTYL